MLELKPLEQTNFHHFINLLKERGETPEDYYRWKYLDQPSYSHPIGFIAYMDEKPVGCIGIINRIYFESGKKENPSTWFADWFVSSTVRGKGIGEALMKEVSTTTSYNFGIPGPLNAQVVCKQAGYTSMEGLYQYTLYINPFRCGFKRFGGSLVRKFLRGTKSMLYSLPVRLKFRSIRNSNSFSIGFPNEEQWEKRMYNLNSTTAQLKRSAEFIRWVGQMPTPTSAKRLWWSIDQVELYACGFMENDFWGLRRAVIVDVYSAQFEKSVWEIAATLSENGVDWITFSYFDQNISLQHWSKTALPLHATTATTISKLHMTDLDKDSSWRSFLFAS